MTGVQTCALPISSNGLAYHATPEHAVTSITWNSEDERIATDTSESYTVTHVASGYSVCRDSKHFGFPAQCRNFIEQISAITDWTVSKPVLTREQQITIQVRAMENKQHVTMEEILA